MPSQSFLQQQNEFGSLPILTTKLYRPPITSGIEARPELIGRLNENRWRTLTLISAPAGYGKTTLASMWLESVDCPTAWVALDEGDNDLHTFTSYLVAALQRTFPDARLVTQDILKNPLTPTAQLLARNLLNDLVQIQKSFVLALDDLYLIQERSVYDLLGELMRHPASNLHMLLITRRDPPLPIASLRARRQVTEVRARDLRFDVPAASRLLSKILKHDVDEVTASEWTQRTEGWVTALQLAALSLRHRDHIQDLAAKLPEDNRYLQDYLLNDVLANLEPARQNWLFAISVLDRFCVPLVDAVCWINDTIDGETLTGEKFIRWLQEENLFLIPLDDRYEWFRLHHLFQTLLQQALQRRFDPKVIVALHRQASGWFNRSGLWDEAIQHAMATGDASAASAIISQHRYELMNTHQWIRLEKWLRFLPDEYINQNPSLLTIKIHLAIQKQSLQGAGVIALLQHVEQLLSTLPSHDEEGQVLRAEVAVNRSLVDVLLGDPKTAGFKAEQCLKVLPNQALLIRLLAESIIAMSQQTMGEYELGLDWLAKASADPRLPFNLQAYALHISCMISFMEGDLDRALAFSRDCVRTSHRSGAPWLIGYARHNMGVILYLRNELAWAEPYLYDLLEERIVSASSYVANGAFALALIHFARGEWFEGEQVLELASSHFIELTDTFAIGLIEACRVELAFRKGDVKAAQHMSAKLSFDLRPPMWFFYVPQLTPIKLLWSTGTPADLVRARDALESLDEKMVTIHRKSVRIDLLSLLALVCDAQGDESAAFVKLTEALHLGERGGFIRNFVDLGQPMAELMLRLLYRSQDLQSPLLLYMRRILDVFQAEGSVPESPVQTVTASPSLPVAPLVEPLTKREMQTLRLLATDLTTQEIAQEMSVSVTTVRTHSRNIYGKLDAHSRFEAVHRAGGLGVL